MKLLLVLKESLYDCKIHITDSMGNRDYYLYALCEDTAPLPSVEIEFFDNNFILSLIPIMPNTDSIINEVEENTWKDKFSKKATKALFKTISHTFLRVGCDYLITDMQDGDRLDIDLQHYPFDTSDIAMALDLVPIEYMFFEVSNFNKRFELTNAYATNRKDVLRFAKTFIFSEIIGEGLFGFFTYPIQMHRIKRLTKNKKIFKTLAKFNTSSDMEREKILDK